MKTDEIVLIASSIFLGAVFATQIFAFIELVPKFDVYLVIVALGGFVFAATRPRLAKRIFG